MLCYVIKLQFQEDNDI